MLFKPVQLGREALDKDVLIADRKSCKRFGPCGVGEKALYLSSFYRSCRYYLPYGGITRAVALEEIGEAYVKWIHITPDKAADGWKAQVEICVRNLSQEVFAAGCGLCWERMER